jgi:hypothetical protein
MRSLFGFLIVSVLAIAVFPSLRAQAPSGSDMKPRVRHVGHDFMYPPPISTLLRADDEVVIMDEVGTAYDLGGRVPTADDLVTLATLASDAVAVVSIKDTRSYLVDDGGWIRSSSRGTVRQVLKSSDKMPMIAGRPFEMTIDGGAVRIGKVLVRSTFGQPLRRGKSYLLFFELNPKTGAASIMYWPLLVSENRLRPVIDEDLPEHDPVIGMSLASVTDFVKRAATKAPRSLRDR